MAQEINENDKLMAAISYPIALLAIIILLVENMRTRAFQKYHAVQSLAVNIALWIIIVFGGCLLSFILAALGRVARSAAGIAGLGTACLWPVLVLLWLVLVLYWAYQAYQGKYFEIPVVTQFIKNQKWV